MRYFKRQLRTLEKRANELLTLSDVLPLSEEELEIKQKCEESLIFFIETFWYVLFGNRKFIKSYPLEAICDHLEALEAGLIKKLLVCAVSRIGKSTPVNIYFPSWYWIKAPYRKILAMSHDHPTTLDYAKKQLLLQKDTFYNRLWGDTFRLQKDFCSVSNFYNTQGGSRKSISIHGGMTGSGGDLRIIDDANRLKDYLNINKIQAVNTIYRSEISTRSEGYDQSSTIVCMQRLNKIDLVGYLLDTQPKSWVHLFLPTEFDPNYVCSTVPLKNGKVWKDKRKIEGESICEQRLTPEAIQDLKAGFEHDERLISAVMQQNPKEDTGIVIDPSWFRVWDSYAPQLDYILQSWDTAFTNKEKNAASACTTWGAFKHPETGEPSVILLSVHAGHWNFADLRKKVYEIFYDFWETDFESKHNPKLPVDAVLIESKASGISVIDEFRATDLPIKRFEPIVYGSKKTRLDLVSHYIENGRVFLKKDKEFEFDIPFVITPGSKEMLKQLKLFPTGPCDILDSMSQALIYLRKLGYLINTNDPANDLFTKFGFFSNLIKS